eukprot:6484843-Amphidinium_carterae.1
MEHEIIYFCKASRIHDNCSHWRPRHCLAIRCLKPSQDWTAREYKCFCKLAFTLFDLHLDLGHANTRPVTVILMHHAHPCHIQPV